ncbi:MAG: DUF3300 domain-containing protein [Rhodanobacter sp.]
MISKRLICVALNAALCASAAALIGCSQQRSSTTAPPAPASAASMAPAPAGTAGQAQPYAPPTAEQLYQLVAPIALFPDKLVAQVLAGSTYPDQVTTADSYLAQNTNLQGSALQDQVDGQSWDPSIKGLTAFPKVLDQMAQNIPWTTSLGEAYVNDPTDVLNAIQVMRQRATRQGSLRNSAQLRVVEQPVAQSGSYIAQADGYPPTYAGPNEVPPPRQEIEILPADPNTVYVPEYNPQTVYGEELPPYPGYRYEPQGYSTGELVATGAIAFGVGIVVASLFEHSRQRERPSYGWNSWGMNWSGRGDGYGGNGGNAGWERPAVVYNNNTYVSNSTTIVNRYVTNDARNSNTANRIGTSSNARNMLAPSPSPAANMVTRAELARPPVAAERKPMRAPDFHGALTPGEPSRFTRAATPAPSSRGMQPVAHTATQPASHVMTAPHFTPAPTTMMHPVRPATPTETARPRFMPQPTSMSHPVPQPGGHAAPVRLRTEHATAVPPRTIRPAEYAAPAPQPGVARIQPSHPQPAVERRAMARPEEVAPSVHEAPRVQTAPPRMQPPPPQPEAERRAVARPEEVAQPVHEAPRVQNAPPQMQPPRAQLEVERRAIARPEEAAPPVHEAPRVQTAPHQSSQLAEPPKEVPKDARKRDKQDAQGH